MDAPYTSYYLTMNDIEGIKTVQSCQIITCYPLYYADDKIFADANIRVYCNGTSKLIFVATEPPKDSTGTTIDLNVLVAVEEYLQPEAEAANLEAEYDNETHTLYCLWNSPDDSGTFVKWQSDTIIIEKKNETTQEWEIIDELTQTFTTANEHLTSPLVIGGEG